MAGGRRALQLGLLAALLAVYGATMYSAAQVWVVRERFVGGIHRAAAQVADDVRQELRVAAAAQ